MVSTSLVGVLLGAGLFLGLASRSWLVYCNSLLDGRLHRGTVRRSISRSIWAPFVGWWPWRAGSIRLLLLLDQRTLCHPNTFARSHVSLARRAYELYHREKN